MTLLPLPAIAQESAPASQESFFTPPVSEPSRFRISGWLNTNFRSSQDHKVKVGFPIPVPFDVYERTPDPGNSFEVSDVTLIIDADVSDLVTGHVKIDALDLYNRNPTSTDYNLDVDEAWIRIGHKYESRILPPGTSFYLLLGKAQKFEKQITRHLESYGLVSTAFNRMPDLQLQFGGSFGRYFYYRAQYSNGNPLFMRDPNALAGDNGIVDPAQEQADQPINRGFPILYDAEVESLHLGSHSSEAGGGLGVRFGNDEGTIGVDFLAYYYDRKLADTQELHGTHYGGDLDVLSAGPVALPYHGRDKKEWGGNIDMRFGGLLLFGQYVDQDIAGLKRRGIEAEIAWRISIPLVFAVDGNQFLTFIQPVVRYSQLDNDFGPVANFPAPSFWWDWKKMDAGIRVGLMRGLDLTVEYSQNDIKAKKPFKLGEGLGTLHLAF